MINILNHFHRSFHLFHCQVFLWHQDLLMHHYHCNHLLRKQHLQIHLHQHLRKLVLQEEVHHRHLRPRRIFYIQFKQNYSLYSIKFHYHNYQSLNKTIRLNFQSHNPLQCQLLHHHKDLLLARPQHCTLHTP